MPIGEAGGGTGGGPDEDGAGDRPRPLLRIGVGMGGKGAMRPPWGSRASRDIPTAGVDELLPKPSVLTGRKLLSCRAGIPDVGPNLEASGVMGVLKPVE